MAIMPLPGYTRKRHAVCMSVWLLRHKVPVFRVTWMKMESTVGPYAVLSNLFIAGEEMQRLCRYSGKVFDNRPTVALIQFRNLIGVLSCFLHTGVKWFFGVILLRLTHALTMRDFQSIQRVADVRFRPPVNNGPWTCVVWTEFWPPDAVRWCGICYGDVDVCLCVCHVDVLCQNDCVVIIVR